MELNSILFPAPQYEMNIEEYEESLIYIPKNNKENTEYIPALFLPHRKLHISRHFLIFFHGNAEDIFLSSDLIAKLRDDLEVNVICVEYPGYSIYKADKCCDTVLENTLIVFDYLTDTLHIDQSNIYVLGRSIGTASASYLASKRFPAAVILISPFTSVRAVAQNLVGNFFKFFISER
jgi:predicted peptidase